jgi:probable HAF family extracellular repeat protein
MFGKFVLFALVVGELSGGFVVAQEAQFAYVASENSDKTLGYKINPVTGEFTSVPGSPVETGQLGNGPVVVDQLGGFFYVLSGEGNLVGFRMNPVTGRFTRLPGPFVSTRVKSIAIDPSGKYAYLSSYDFSGVSAYRIDQGTGQLKVLPGSPFSSPGIDSGQLAVDPMGKFVYVIEDLNPLISGFSINPANGSLQPIPGAPFSYSGIEGTLSIAIDPLDRFLYVTQPGALIVGFTMNSTTGALTSLPAPFGTGTEPEVPTVDPRGKFVYVAGLQGIYGYTINQFNDGPNSLAGGLTTIAGSPFGSANGQNSLYPISVTVDYTGTFVYATYYLGGVVVFRIDPSTGTLTQLTESPFDTGGSPPAIGFFRPIPNPVYSATQVPEPTFGPYKTFTGTAINNKGEVTGQAVFFSPDVASEAFLFDGTTTTGFSLLGSKGNIGSSINGKGEIVGTFTPPAADPVPDLTQAYLYRTAGVTFNLDPRLGGQSVATGINNAEHITGAISTGVCNFMFGQGCTTLGDTHAFLDSGLGPMDIGTLGGNFSQGMGINQHDEIVGASNATTNGPNHVFVYSQGSMRDAGMFDHDSSIGTAINDEGKIIGTAIGPTGTPIGFVLSDGGFEPIPGLDGGTTSLPSGINRQGNIVGASDVGGGGANHAVLYREGKLVDLNDLVDPSLTLLTGAAGINDKGQIVAGGLNGGVYVLTPIRPDGH